METIWGTWLGDVRPSLHSAALAHGFNSRSKSSVPESLRPSSSRVRVLANKARTAVNNVNLKADIDLVIQARSSAYFKPDRNNLDSERATTA